MKLVLSTGMVKQVSASGRTALLGDGRDGSQTFNGTSTVLGIVPDGSKVYTLPRNIYCTDMTVDALATIKTNGYKIFCTGTLTNNGKILCEGNTGASGGAALPATSEFNGSGAGGAGAVGAGGSAGGDGIYTMRTTPGSAGTGGVGGGIPTQAPGPGGADQVRPMLPVLPLLRPSNLWMGGAGEEIRPRALPVPGLIGGGAGGGGGGRGAGSGGVGGTGGSGGGCIALYAATLVNNAAGSLISASGGAGAIGPSGGTYGGGGGGGGSGGSIFLYYKSATITSSKVLVDGGPGGGGGPGGTGGAGVTGSTGASGVILKFNASTGIWE